MRILTRVPPAEATVDAQSTAPRYAVVVATRNRGAKIVPLIESILASDVREFEVVVVDQSTADDTRKAIEPFLADRRVRYVFSELCGTSRARNLAISLTSAPIIVITDDDCLVPRNWLAAIAQPFEDHPRVGVVFCNVDPVPVAAPGYTPHIRFAENRIISTAGEAWAVSKHGLALGAGMAVRRTTIDSIGGFDELLGPGGTFPSAEDNDLSWRALMRGWRVFQNSDVTVIHDGFRTLDELRRLVSRDHYAVGGTVAKYLKSGHWQIMSFLVSWLVRFGVIDPAIDILNRRRPRGFRRPYMVVRGLLDGLRRPIDPGTLCYRSS